MARQYEIPEEKACMVSETAVAIWTNEQTPHTMVKSMIVPCTFTDEEFKEELLQSESSGFVSNEVFKKSCLAKWGVAL